MERGSEVRLNEKVINFRLSGGSVVDRFWVEVSSSAEILIIPHDSSACSWPVSWFVRRAASNFPREGDQFYYPGSTHSISGILLL